MGDGIKGERTLFCISVRNPNTVAPTPSDKTDGVSVRPHTGSEVERSVPIPSRPALSPFDPENEKKV